MDHENPVNRREALRGAAAIAVGLASQSTSFAQDAKPLSQAGSGQTVSGIVYENSTGSARQPSDRGVPGVLVSNGREVVKTDSAGRYSLPLEDEAVIFVIKPAGYMAPVDPVTKLPRFSYVHQPKGSPANLKLRFQGISPTGPIPQSLDFALIPQNEPSKYDVVLLTDPQPETEAELDFVRDDVIQSLIGVKAAFGMTTGDILFDDLSMYTRHNRIVGQVGVPWWNIGGNHDLNFEAPDRTHSRETFKRVFGAPYYAFYYADALYLMLDNVNYLGADPKLPYKGGKYEGKFGERQLAFVANVLKETPADRLVVVAMHIPLTTYLSQDKVENSIDRADFLKLLAGRKSLSFAGHTHTTEHHYIGADGVSEGDHHHHVLTAVSGSWWSGPYDYRGVATAVSRDGSPNGFHILSVDGANYSTRFVPAKEPQGRQMRIMFDSVYHSDGKEVERQFRAGRMFGSPITSSDVFSTDVVVNVFDGGPRTKVEMTVGGRAPLAMTPDRRPDPLVRQVYARYDDQKKPWVKAEPSSHIWVARLPQDLSAGTHKVAIRVMDEYGRAHEDHTILEVLAA